MQFKIEGLEALPSTDARVTVHKLLDGSTLPLTVPPLEGDQIPSESFESAQGVRKAGDAVAVLDRIRRAVANDRTLSKEGRVQKVGPALQALREAITEGEARAARLEAAARVLHDQAFAVPNLEASDLVGGLLDNEIRLGVRAMNASERTAYMKTLEGNPRHVEAIKRSPLPIPLISEHADRLWAASRENTPLAKKAAILAESAEWARGNLYSIKRIR